MAIACPICNKKYANKYSLSQHRHKYHSNQEGGQQKILRRDQGDITSSIIKNDIEYSSDTSESADEACSNEENSVVSEKELAGNIEWMSEKKRLERKHKNEIQYMKEKLALYKNTEALQNEDQLFITELEKIIFSEPVMSDILKIEKLVNKYNFEEIITYHSKTIQYLFIAVSYGVVPVTRPQKTEITDSQRELVYEIQNIELEKLDNVIMENRQELVNLFSIIEDSIKLARKSFHKFLLNRINQQNVPSGSEASTQDANESLDNY